MESLIMKRLDSIEKLIRQQNLEQKTVLTIEETAIYLNLSKSSLYKMTSRREIPFFNPGGKKIYFKKTDIETWLFSSKEESEDEASLEIEKYLSRTTNRNLI